MKPRIYIDTSVIGGNFDEEFKDESIKFFNRIERKDFEVYFSEVNEAELSLAPDHIKEIKNKIPQECYNYLELTEEVRDLANAYINNKVLGHASLNDAYHIAFASVYRLDVLVSWNFKHIVKLKTKNIVKMVNTLQKYKNIEIITPAEILD